MNFQSLLPHDIYLQAEQHGINRFKVLNFYKKYFQDKIEMNENCELVGKKVIQFMNKRYKFYTLQVVYHKKDGDGNVKIGFKTGDEHIIETVILSRGNENSICISTQIGCKMGCKFCATGHLGFVRNLESWEIIEQVRLGYLNFLKPLGKRLTHITIMGMGEPLDNFENTYQAFLVLTNPYSYSVAYKKVALATSGYLPGMKKLAEKDKKPVLVISLHASNQKIREKLLPVSKFYSLKEILNFLKDYPLKKGKKHYLQYLLLKDVNDSVDYAEELALLLKEIPAKINFMRYNKVDSLPFEPAEETTRDYFIKYLKKSGFVTIKRRSVGGDIKAACGQLGLESYTYEDCTY